MNHDDAEDESAGPSHWSRDEWLLMFMRGVPIARIAKVCRVPLRSVSAAIYSRLKAEPWRRGHRLVIHDQPSLRTEPARRPTWGERCESLRLFHKKYDRLPSFQSSDPFEKSLIYWIYGQRRKDRAGELTKDHLAQLNTVPGWNRPPKAAIEEGRWQQRLAETVAFNQQYKRWPRYPQGITAEEKTIAVWLGGQRQKLRNGTLRHDRRKAMDRKMSGWAPPLKAGSSE